MIKVLFVCLGNICRSPMAEAIFNEKVRKYQLEGRFSIDSAGTGSWHIGADPDYRTIKIAENNQVPINHKGRQFALNDANNDYIMVMDHSNRQTISSLVGSDHKGLYLMRHFDQENKDAEVPDPYYGGLNDFQEVFEILDRSCEGFILFLKEKHLL